MDTRPVNSIDVLDGQGFVALLDHMGNEMTICNAARVSFAKHKILSNKLEDNDIKLIKYMYNNKHSSPFEHVVFTFLIKCPLFVRSQWHRHRTWSFNEISRRYTEENISFYTPTQIRKQSNNNKQASIEFNFDKQTEADIKTDINNLNIFAFAIYKSLLKNGLCREQARGVLPQNMMTEFYGTIDLWNLINFLNQRDSPHAQYEIRVYAQAIKKLISPLIPITSTLIENKKE